MCPLYMLEFSGVAIIVSVFMLPRSPLLAENVGGATHKSDQPHPLVVTI